MRILLTGASGQLGAYLIGRLLDAKISLVAWSGQARGDSNGITLTPVNLDDAKETELALERADPDVTIHAAAVSSIEGVRLNPEDARAVNVGATARIADWCGRKGRGLVFTSTDLVFDGTKPWNREDDPPRPVVAYGRTKAEAETAVLAIPNGLVARLSLLYGSSRTGRPSYLDRTVAGLRRGEPQAFFEDEFRTPLDLASAAEILVRLANDRSVGIVHVGGSERMSRFELARRSAVALGFAPGLVRANRQADVAFAEPRPADLSLDTAKLAAHWADLRRPTVEEALAHGPVRAKE